MYQMAGAMAISMYSAAQASKARAEEEMANNIARTEQRKLQFNREQQAYLSNIIATKKQETSDVYNINIAAAEAQDQLDMARAGSGLSGSSINELDDEVLRAVSADKVSAHRTSLMTQDQLDTQRISANENRQLEANQTRTSIDPQRDIANAAIGSLGQGLASMDPSKLGAFTKGTGSAPSLPEPAKDQWITKNSRMYGKSAFIA